MSAPRRCVLCGRDGPRGFRSTDAGEVVCSSARACLARYRVIRRRDTAAERERDAVLAERFVPPPPPCDADGDFAMDISLSYASEVLNWDYGLDVDDDHPAIRAMAAAMDDAWFEAAYEWRAVNDAWLRSIPTFPRECWCGRWPPLGTSCHYHGRCTCLEYRPVHYAGQSQWDIVKPGYVHGYEDTPVITLPGDCPVHPADRVPDEHVVRLRDHLRAHRGGRTAPWGRPEPPVEVTRLEPHIV